MTVWSVKFIHSKQRRIALSAEKRNRNQGHKQLLCSLWKNLHKNLALKLATLIPQGINKCFSFNWFSSVCYVTVSADSGISMLTVSSIVSFFTIVEEENRDIVGLSSTKRQKIRNSYQR